MLKKLFFFQKSEIAQNDGIVEQFMRDMEQEEQVLEVNIIFLNKITKVNYNKKY